MPERKNRIAIIGPYPPPFGGISVHIQRVVSHLPPGSYTLYNSHPTDHPGSVNFYGKQKYLRFLRFVFLRYRLIHSHSTDPLVRILLGILAIFRRNIYLHIHGESLSDYLEKKHPGSAIMKYCIRYLNILACNSKLYDELIQYRPVSIREIDAFIPPVFDPEIMEDYMSRYHAFYGEQRFILSTTGWFDYYRGEDLYGYDIILEAFHRCVENGMNVALAMSVNGIRDRGLYEQLVEKINRYGMGSRVLMILEDLPEAWPVFMASHVFIRATNTDGAAVSIREARWLETPVIASDCVVRPEGVTLFRSRSAEDLYDKIVYLYQKPHRNLAEKRESVRDKKFTSTLFQEVYGLQG